KKSLFEDWNHSWFNTSPHDNKLRAIKNSVSKWKTSFQKSRLNEVCLMRLLIGHTNATHIHLIKKQDAPMCDVCQSRITVKHVLKDCTKYQHIRSPNNLYDYLPSDPSPILAFIEKANLKI
ncbi:hypothetical protein WDU94_015094, partial [Cyamophila willieti]